MWQSPYWPRPPVCFLYLPCARASLRIVSRYGTRGWCRSTSTPKRRRSRSTATSTWICDSPERSCSPVCGSRRRTSVGSSSCRRRIDVALGVEEQVAGLRVLQLRHRADVARPELRRLVVLLALEEQELADALLRVHARVHERGVAGEGPVEDAEEVDATREGVRDRLEDERRGRGAVRRDGGLLVGRRGNPFGEQVEQRRRAEVLRRDAARDREELAARHGRLERARHLLRRQLLALEVALHQRLVRLDDGVEQLRVQLLDAVGHLGRDLGRAALAP